MVLDLKARFPIKRSILVGDRGLLSEDKLETLTEAELDYIVSMPLRRNKLAEKAVRELAGQVKEKRKAWKQNKTPLAEQECFLDVVIDGRRFVLSHSEEIAQQSKKTRKSALSQATSYTTWRVARTLGQHDVAIPVKGKALTHQETFLHVHDYLKERKLKRYYRLWLDEDGALQWEPDEKSRKWEN